MGEGAERLLLLSKESEAELERMFLFPVHLPRATVQGLLLCQYNYKGYHRGGAGCPRWRKVWRRGGRGPSVRIREAGLLMSHRTESQFCHVPCDLGQVP